MSAAVAGTIPGLNGELHHYYRLDPYSSRFPGTDHRVALTDSPC